VGGGGERLMNLREKYVKNNCNRSMIVQVTQHQEVTWVAPS
jgi:hypothetical protein